MITSVPNRFSLSNIPYYEINTAENEDDLFDALETMWNNEVQYTGDYESFEDFVQSCSEFGICKFWDPTFNKLLDEFLRTKSSKASETVRCHTRLPLGAFYMFHGCNYDWKDRDLLGGTGDGKRAKEFEEWVNDYL